MSKQPGFTGIVRKTGHGLHVVLRILTAVIFIMLTLDVLLGIFTRKLPDWLLASPPRWTEELATFLLVWLVFLATPLAYMDNRHLGINMVVDNMHPDTRRRAAILTHSIVFIFSIAVLLYGGTLLTLERLSFGQEMSALKIGKAWLYMSVPVCGLLMTFFSLEKLLLRITGQTSEEEQEASEELEEAL